MNRVNEQTKQRGEGTPPTDGSIARERGGETLSAAKGKLTGKQWRQVVLISASALALYVGFRLLPTGTNLNHLDFRTGGAGSLEMCDPSNPQFIPVVAVRSPVAMTVATNDGAPARAGAEVSGVVTLQTASGKPIGPQDLLVAHTRKLHLLIVDETLTDYQHVHPEPAKTDGAWVFSFRPRETGIYRVFADFTPAATARGLYAHADLNVVTRHGADLLMVKKPVSRRSEGREVVIAGDFVFGLEVKDGAIKAGRMADLAFSIRRADGGDVTLRPVMDAYAHLVAFDEARSGFAHLHPNETDLTRAPDAKAPRLTFKITIPKAGRYVIWAQVDLGGSERFVPFEVTVAE